MTFDRRAFVAAAAASPILLGATRAFAHLGREPVLKIAVIGCGGRGTGAMFNAINAGKTSGAKIEVVALGDLFPERVTSANNAPARLSASSRRTNAPSARSNMLPGYALS